MPAPPSREDPSGLWSEDSPFTVAGAAAVSHRIPFSPRRRGTVPTMHKGPALNFQRRS
jgi:hypothetical protein